MTDKTETNTNENSVAPASRVGRLVIWIDAEKEKPMCQQYLSQFSHGHEWHNDQNKRLPGSFGNPT